MKWLSVRFTLAALLLSLVGCAGTGTPSRQDPKAYTAFDAAVEACDLVQTKHLVADNSGLVKERGWSDTSPLYLAALNDCTEVAAFLLQKGANVDGKSKGGATPLHIAAQKNNLVLVKLLLAHRANINSIDAEKRTPLDRARQWHRPGMVQFLLHHGGRSGSGHQN
jgi:ankyrin repeat protein